MIPSRGVKVAGVLGPAAPVERKSAAVADIPVGIGGTTQWKLAGLVRAPACEGGLLQRRHMRFGAPAGLFVPLWRAAFSLSLHAAHACSASLLCIVLHVVQRFGCGK